MTNEEMLQNVINNLIERMGRQTVTYESEIANLNAQISLLQSQIEQSKSEVSKLEKVVQKARNKDSSEDEE